MESWFIAAEVFHALVALSSLFVLSVVSPPGYDQDRYDDDGLVMMMVAGVVDIVFTSAAGTVATVDSNINTSTRQLLPHWFNH